MPLFIHPPAERHSGCLQVLAIINKAATGTCTQVSVWAEVLPHLVLLFWLLTKIQIGVQSYLDVFICISLRTYDC